MNSIQLRRNDLCPCRSGQKYKRCCFPLAFPAPTSAPAAKLAQVVAKPLKDASWVQVHFNPLSNGARSVGDRASVRSGSQSQPPAPAADDTPVEQGRWVAANQLRPGDQIRTMDGWVTVEGVVDTGRVETVYNLEIEDDHTYFVGGHNWGFSVWAHNADCAEQAAARRGIEKRLASTNPMYNALLARKADFVHTEIMRIAETAIQVGRSTGRGNHVGQIFKDLLQPLHKKLADLNSRFNIEIEPRILNDRRVLGKERGHERLDAIITELPPGARRPALDPKMTFETQGMSMQQRKAALVQLEGKLDYHTIIHGYDISIAHYPVNGHANPLFTSAIGWTKAAVGPHYTAAFSPRARPGFQALDVRVIADQFLVNGAAPRPVRPLVDGVLQ